MGDLHRERRREGLEGSREPLLVKDRSGRGRSRRNRSGRFVFGRSRRPRFAGLNLGGEGRGRRRWPLIGWHGLLRSGPVVEGRSRWSPAGLQGLGEALHILKALGAILVQRLQHRTAEPRKRQQLTAHSGGRDRQLAQVFRHQALKRVGFERRSPGEEFERDAP